jgi:hypothetical protein
MNNILSYFGLVDVRINASDKDLLVTCVQCLPTPTRDKSDFGAALCHTDSNVFRPENSI